MSDVLRQELSRIFTSGDDLIPGIDRVPYKLRADYRERRAFLDQYTWWAKGEMARVIGGKITKELVNLPGTVESTGNELRVQQRGDKQVLVQTAITEEFGELAPHVNGKLIAGKKT